MLHPWRSAQHVLLCDACETVPLQSHCQLCNISLCTNCVGKHLFDSSKKHRVVLFIERSSTPNNPECPNHPDKHCELHCNKCNIPVCSTCVSSGQHRGHDISEIQKTVISKTQDLRKDLEELETKIYTQYEEINSDVQTEQAELESNYEKLTVAADQHGEALHREITAIVNRRKSDITEMKTKHLAVLKKNTDETTHNINELRQIILNMRAVLESNNVSLISTYRSRNNEFRKLPPKVRVTLPSLSSQEVNTEQLNEMLGSMSSLSISTEEQEYIIKAPEAAPAPLFDEPRLTATINTGYIHTYSVSCLSEEQVWTRGNDKIMKRFDLQGKLLTSVQTKSGNVPEDIAVTRDGDLVYTDPNDQTVNLVWDKRIQTVITLQGWEPLYVCSTSCNEFLVIIASDDGKQCKVVRYSGSKEKQIIQFDDRGRPLYSSNYNDKYIGENRNLDICVADHYNGRVHIIDQDGQFLRYIQNCHLRNPWGLCVDIRDNLFCS